jgi:ferredoxin-NADP reductase
VKGYKYVPLIRKIKCTVQEIENHGSHVYSLTLQPEKEIPVFQPGQFLHLAIDPYDPSGFWPDSRAFSIASSPQERDTLRLAYSVKGAFTARMEKELQPGREVWVKMPYGDFLVSPTEPVTLIAGGTGITAFTAFLASLTPEYPQEVHLFYGAREPGLLLYRTHFEDMSRTNPNFHLHLAVEQGCPENDRGCHTGPLSIEWILETMQQPDRQIFFLSGPPAMLNKFTADLEQHGIKAGKIRVDAWE